MKNIFFIYLSIFLIFSSCSNEVLDEGLIIDNQVALSDYIFKTFNVSNTPNTVIDSINFQIENNRIINSTGMNLETLNQNSSSYIYTNDRISEIESFTNGVLSRVQSYTYDTNGNLTEFLSEVINSNNQGSSFNKHTFNHTSDTIFSSWRRSSNGTDFNINITDSKIVLDANENRVYYEEFDYLNNEIKSETNSYDNNSNSVNDSKYININGNTILLFENNYTTSSSENLLNRINEATYTRKNMMLLYHLQSDAINSINARNISKNILTTFSSTFGNSFVDFEILNTTDDNNLTTLSDFRSIVSGNLFTRFTQEFIFQ